MKKSTSFHGINNDRGLGYFKKFLWYIFNLLSNNYKPNTSSSTLIVKKYICDDLNEKWNDPNLYTASSPQRKLSDIFIADFPWNYYKKILNGLHIVDVGCGSGNYGRKKKEQGGSSKKKENKGKETQLFMIVKNSNFVYLEMKKIKDIFGPLLF